MAGLRFKNIKKIYGNKVEAVKNFSMQIDDKEFIVLVGPSGCGKTTVLRMIAGLETVTGGELYIGDTLVNKVEPKDRDIAMVFQNYALYPHMTVYKNMAFPLKMHKMPKDEIKKRVESAAELLEISEYLSRKPKALSGGQRQRVAIGRAIVREPQAFLMDEPLSNLDAKLRNQMRAELIKLHSRLCKTFIYVTHDQTEAMTLGDRIVVMKDGLIQQIGAPREVYNNPANLFVAGFIGSPQMNFINDVPLMAEKGVYEIELFGKKIALNTTIQTKLREKNITGNKVVFGIRPEHILIIDGEGMEAKIEICELMGAEFHIHAVTEDKESILIRINANKSLNFCAGEIIKFNFMQDEIHLLTKIQVKA